MQYEEQSAIYVAVHVVANNTIMKTCIQTLGLYIPTFEQKFKPTTIISDICRLSIQATFFHAGKPLFTIMPRHFSHGMIKYEAPSELHRHYAQTHVFTLQN